MDEEQASVLRWWIQEQEDKDEARSYIRSSHMMDAILGQSFRIFWRYYDSIDYKDLKRFLRLTRDEFDSLYTKLEVRFGCHAPTHLRPITGKERLAVFLCFLSFGPTYPAVAHLFGIGDLTVQEICFEVSTAIIDLMQPEYLPIPTRETWLGNSERFLECRQFPHAIGATDGKHIGLVKPNRSGVEFYNYKKFHSIVMLAMADSDSRFICVDIEAPGRNGDSALWRTSPILRFMESPTANIPQTAEGELPYVLLGDGGFGLTDLVITPYTQRGADEQEKIDFNERLSRARACVEHAFGIWASKWRIFFGIIEASPDVVRKYAMVAVILHNFLLPTRDEEAELIPYPQDRRLLIDQRNPLAGRLGRDIRNKFVDVIIRGE